MSPEPGRAETRELRLEGFGLAAVGVLLLLAVVGAFLAGRWYERQAHPARAVVPATGAGTKQADDAVRAPVDVGAGAGHFDRVEGPQQQLEPGREARRVPASQPPAAEGKPAATAAPGDFFVQVFAGRDESAARGLVERLERGGQRVVLHGEPEGAGVLFKVRVGGFATEAEAREAARQLQAQGYPGAWVTRGDAR